jgi:lipoate-protein ligase B
VEETDLKPLYVVDLGRSPYGPVFDMQKRMVEERREGKIHDMLILVEHDPVYTIGRNAYEGNITASKEQLEEMGIEVIETDRGGDVTYHGPGQLVGYPIIDLGREKTRVQWYISGLEKVLIMTLEDFGVQARTDECNRGAWVGTDKIAAIGIRISRRITMHGFALNVCTNLDDYRGIVPCGIAHRGVTSLNRFVPDVVIGDVKPKLVRAFKEVFEYGDEE